MCFPGCPSPCAPGCNPPHPPQVARQLATVAGLGRRRHKPKKEEKAKLGQEGEDIVADETGESGWV